MKTLAFVLFIAGIGVVLSTGPAVAQCCGCATTVQLNQAKKEILQRDDDNRDKVIERIDELETALMKKLQEVINAIGDLKESTMAMLAKQTEAIGGFEDAAQVEETKRELGKQAIDVQRDFSISQTTVETHCKSGSGALALGDAAKARENCNGSGSGDGAGGNGGTEQAITKVLTNADKAAKEGGARYIAARFERYLSRYCDPEMYDGKAPSGCAGGQKMNADVTAASTLLNRMTLETPEDQQAVDDLLLNLTAPVVPNPVPGSQAETMQGKAAVMGRRSTVARSNMGNAALIGMKEMRMPMADPTWAEEVTGEQMPDQISEYQLLDVMLFKRYTNQEFWAGINSLDEAATQREIINMLAVQHMIAWREYQLLERLLAQNATGIGAGAVSAAGAPNPLGN